MLPLKLLFICTHNRCRSILAEALANHYSQGLIVAASAGSEPAGQVHPLTLKALRNNGIAIHGLSSKSWDELVGFEPDFVITVCDKAAQEECPLWFGSSLKSHWGLSDPSAGTLDEVEMMQAFDITIQTLIHRIETLVEFLKKDPDGTALVDMINNLSVKD